MEALALAQAYVRLDRFAFYCLQKSSAFQPICASVEQRLRANEGWTEFKKLCEMGAERQELLWLLAGCEGLPGFNKSQQVFGWSAPQLKTGLRAIELAASVIEKMQRHPFGLLASHAHAVGASDLAKDLRSYLALAREARRDFGHRSEWFLNIAKARIVIHVTYRTERNPHDNEVSGLIAAMTGTDYNADAQRQWRHKHSDLVQDVRLDPYTTKNGAERERVRRTWERIAAQGPHALEYFARFTDAYGAIAQSRRTNLPNRKSTKNAS